MTTDQRYVVVGTKPWNRRIFDDRISHLPGTWAFAATAAELDELLAHETWRFAFFLHWSSIVPESVLARVECVVFHMTAVPYGRGGSPLQNLIVRGHTETTLTALRMTAELDAGPVYLQRPLSLDGTAESILIRSSDVAADMIGVIIATQPEPTPQSGAPETFRRRTPAESALPTDGTLDELHDFIRMLDAEGYPPAFLDHGPFRIELRRAARYEGRLEADVRITLREVTT